MAEETPELKRDSTMAVTAKEGAEILKGEDLGKTRAESATKKTDEDNNESENGSSEAEEEKHSNGTDSEDAKDDEKPAVKRDGTMVATAAEGEEFLKSAGHDGDSTTRGEAAAVKAAIEESEKDKENGQTPEESKEEEEKPDLKRKTTMAETVEEGEEFLKKQKCDSSEAKEVVEAEA